MSDGGGCENPGVGDRPNNNRTSSYGAYNPGEVRLYGRPADMADTMTVKTSQINELAAISRDNIEEFKSKIDDIIQYGSRAPGDFIKFSVTIRGDVANAIERSGGEVVELSLLISGSVTPNIVSLGIIYGYAYEGHCYKLPKPQIMLLPQPARDIVDCDCGYKADLGYAVWQIDKLERAVVLDVRSDDIKTLVLDTNMPGSRSPLAYAAAMSLAPHRSSRD